MKICYVIESMYNSGGMERVLTVCANALCHEVNVSILTLCQQGRDFYFNLEDSIMRYDLGLANVQDKKILRKGLEAFLKSHYFDIVISLGGIDMYYLHSINDGSEKIVWFHFDIDIAKTVWAGPNPTLTMKYKAKFQTWKRIYYAKKYKKIILISKADYEKWNKLTKKAVLIYNPITIARKGVSVRNNKCVISVGRLDYQKGYDLLITAWAQVAQKHSDWRLDIFGEGELRSSLQELINNLQLNNNVRLCGRVMNIEEKYPLYSFYVMSSRAEGLGLVLIEASFCGLPLISFDCPSGPSEIIQSGNNGILVKQVGDIKGMAEAINRLIENPELRNQMGENAIRMIERFSLPNITKQWVELFGDIINNGERV